MAVATPASCRKGSADLFHSMHTTVLDYTPLLDIGWDKRLSQATSQLAREAVMLELWKLCRQPGDTN